MKRLFFGCLFFVSICHLLLLVIIDDTANNFKQEDTKDNTSTIEVKHCSQSGCLQGVPAY